MKQRFGGLLSIALGAVLIFAGLNAGASGVVGQNQGPYTCDSVSPAGVMAIPPCPTGQIAITSVTDTSAPGAATPPDTWTVTITSTCLDPDTNEAVNRTVTVPDGGSVTSDGLNIFNDSESETVCKYFLTQEPVAGFTTTFDPESPIVLEYVNDEDPNETAVTLNNVADGVATSSAPAPTSEAPSSSGAAPASTNVAAPTPISSGAALAETGPRTQIGISLWIGIALCLLGLGLLFEGRIRRLARHRG